MSTAPANSGRKSSPTCSGAVAGRQQRRGQSVADTEAAAANSARTIPATGIVLVEHGADRQQRAACARYWLTISTTISASPPSSGTSVMRVKEWVSQQLRGAEERGDARRRPQVRSRAGPVGRCGSAGGASSKVSIDSTNAVSEIAATIQNSGRQASALAWMPPIERAERDRAEDAHVHDHGGRAELATPEAERQRRHGRDQQQARAQTLQHVAGDEHRRIRARPLSRIEPISSTPRKGPSSAAGAAAARTEPPAPSRPRSAALAMPEPRLIVCRLMCSCSR